MLNKTLAQVVVYPFVIIHCLQCEMGGEELVARSDNGEVQEHGVDLTKFPVTGAFFKDQALRIGGRLDETDLKYPAPALAFRHESKRTAIC